MMRASQTCHVEVGRGTKAELTSAQILSLLEILIATLLEPRAAIIWNLNQPTAFPINPPSSPSFLPPGWEPRGVLPGNLVVLMGGRAHGHGGGFPLAAFSPPSCLWDGDQKHWSILEDLPQKLSPLPLLMGGSCPALASPCLPWHIPGVIFCDIPSPKVMSTASNVAKNPHLWVMTPKTQSQTLQPPAPWSLLWEPCPRSLLVPFHCLHAAGLPRRG